MGPLAIANSESKMYILAYITEIVIFGNEIITGFQKLKKKKGNNKSFSSVNDHLCQTCP